MTGLVAALAVGLGAALGVTGVLLRARERREDLVMVLDLPSVEDRENVSSAFAPALKAANRTLGRVRMVGQIGAQLERARIPLKPVEFFLALSALGATCALIAWFLSGQVFLGGVAAVAVIPAARSVISMRIERRRKAFEAQLPEALSLISSSLEAGHTFLHSIEMMVEESEQPLAEEFERVVVETQLGHPLLDALQHMSERVGVGDLAWVVQAINIQQSVGGTLAEVLGTLAEFMRTREEVRREVRVLTAEGRLSAVVLGFLPVGVFLVLKVLNPAYLDPMLHGKGLFALAGAGASVLAGMTMIRKMAKVEV